MYYPVFDIADEAHPIRAMIWRALSEISCEVIDEDNWTIAYSMGYREAMREVLVLLQHPDVRAAPDVRAELVAEFWAFSEFRDAFRDAGLKATDFDIPRKASVEVKLENFPWATRIPTDSYEHGRVRAFSEGLELLASIDAEEVIRAFVETFGQDDTFRLAFEWAGLDPAEFKWEESALDETAEWDIPPEWLEEEPFNAEIEDEE